MKKNLSEILINLKPEEIVRAQRIVLDNDPEEALRFMVECLGAKIDAATGRCG